MNLDNLDPKLSTLLRESRQSPALPSRFQEAVWRRIEIVDASRSANSFLRLEALVNTLLRPRLALAAVATLVLLGAMLGAREGAQTARRDAEARYLTAVARGVLE